MKTIKLLAVLFIATLTFTSCSDDETPEEVHEEEVITTMNITLTSGDEIITISSVDLDGDAGSDLPDITGGTLQANTTYTASIELLNETESPAENITEEVEEEGEDHQFFFTSSDDSLTFTYDDEDTSGNPIGIDFSVTTNAAGSITMTVILKHEPTKPNDGTSTDAGGETDIEVSFPITVEADSSI